MREFINEIFSGTYALFTGKFLASFVMLPMFFMSFGTAFPTTLSNIVDEGALYDYSRVPIDEVKEPDAGNGIIDNSINEQQITPVGIVDSTPVYDLVIPEKVATSVIGVGVDSSGAVAVPNSGAGYYTSNGAHLLVGHNTGAFAGLSSVSIGEIITFRGEDYEIYGKQIYDYDPSVGLYNPDNSLNSNGAMMRTSLYSGGSTGLNLMTCYGSYLASYGTYNQRLVVFASKAL